MVVEHISIELKIADPLTKGMPPKKFKDHVIGLGLGSMMESHIVRTFIDINEARIPLVFLI